ncbi:hypothetical protein Btru_044115 [Bulinus truncatus]|nr:hypothetical protein Btru_044115 [Bulinus truncatus]
MGALVPAFSGLRKAIKGVQGILTVISDICCSSVVLYNPLGTPAQRESSSIFTFKVRSVLPDQSWKKTLQRQTDMSWVLIFFCGFLVSVQIGTLYARAFPEDGLLPLDEEDDAMLNADKREEVVEADSGAVVGPGEVVPQAVANDVKTDNGTSKEEKQVKPAKPKTKTSKKGSKKSKKNKRSKKQKNSKKGSKKGNKGKNGKKSKNGSKDKDKPSKKKSNKKN